VILAHGPQRTGGAVDWTGVAAYRRLTPQQRADHVETLIMLGRLVVGLPTRHRMLRAFVVMTVVAN
jgi:hypothetical protein